MEGETVLLPNLHVSWAGIPLTPNPNLKSVGPASEEWFKECGAFPSSRLAFTKGPSRMCHHDEREHKPHCLRLDSMGELLQVYTENFSHTLQDDVKPPSPQLEFIAIQLPVDPGYTRKSLEQPEHKNYNSSREFSARN